MSIATRINAIEEHIGNAYNKLDDLGIDLTNVDKNIENIAEMLDTVYQDYPKVTGQGTEVTLDGTKVGKLGLDIKGNSIQTTRLLPDSYTQLEYIESTGTQYINTNYTPVQGDDFEFKNVKINGNGALFGAGTGDYDIILLYQSPTYYYRCFSSGSAQSFTISVPVTNIKIINGALYFNDTIKTSTTYGGAVNTSLYIFNRANLSSIIKAQIGEVIITNNNVKKHHYVPCKRNLDNVIGMYDIVGNTFLTNAGTGTFSYGNLPTPNYPVPIYSAGDEGTISEKIVNKNLLINNKTTVTYVGITFTVNDDKSITMSGTATSQSNLYLFGSYTEYVDLGLPPGNYVFSGITGGSTSTYINYLVKKDKNENISTYAQTTEPRTFTINEGDTFRVFLRVIGGYSFGDNPVTAYPQLELSSTATTYTAHQEQTYTIPVQQPMRSIGTVRDEFIQLNGNWFERHNIGYASLDGTQGTFSKPSTNRFNIDNAITDYLHKHNETTYLSNLYKGYNQKFNNADFNTLVSNVNYGFDFSSGAGASNIRIKDTRYDNVDDFKTWLSNNNLIIIYVLEIPTDLPCTEEQISILENLPKSYNEQTNIYSLDVTPAYFDASALKA